MTADEPIEVLAMGRYKKEKHASYECGDLHCAPKGSAIEQRDDENVVPWALTDERGTEVERGRVEHAEGDCGGGGGGEGGGYGGRWAIRETEARKRGGKDAGVTEEARTAVYAAGSGGRRWCGREERPSGGRWMSSRAAAVVRRAEEARGGRAGAPLSVTDASCHSALQA